MKYGLVHLLKIIIFIFGAGLAIYFIQHRHINLGEWIGVAVLFIQVVPGEYKDPWTLAYSVVFLVGVVLMAFALVFNAPEFYLQVIALCVIAIIFVVKCSITFNLSWSRS